ncbi:CPBP family intramembrane metalloprotease [Bacillus sp. V3B]|uniref:CPBP family intramembrane glutamic endopeptidase n=1 Tax=Bacillus sp. V3B TaxID=2804915 RepID=UPI00210E44BE|nr:type II CAAX endopeptidase family protein [Bacillus sp. V3B]MCQ6273844.1 CPBP family intramembrane metalloprotease [Bacillus sp. V3B]
MKKKYVDLIKEISDRELILSLYTTQILLLIISFFLGVFLFDSYSTFFDLFHWQDINILLVGGMAGIAVVILDLVLMKILPAKYYDDGGLNERMFQKRSLFEIAMIAAVVSIGEEILFRGVIQTHLGLILSSLIFAFVHYRYLFNWFLFVNITGLSFFIGYIYLQTGNVLVTIFMHFLIDFLLGCIIKFKFAKKHKEQEGIFDE